MPESLVEKLELASERGRRLLGSAAAQAGPALAAAAHRFERLFMLRSPFAPGLHFIGGQATTATGERLSFGGTGLSDVEALTSCLGEGVEYLSSVEREGDVALSFALADAGGRVDADIADWTAAHRPPPAAPLDWIHGVDARTGDRALLPADLCLRRSASRRRLATRGHLSTGCAAGPSFAAAAVRATLELVERDALALWWLGGQRGRPVAAEERASTCVEALRAGDPRRVSWLLDITTDLDIPTIVALSTGADGRSLAFGAAARLDREEAARSALLEMAQVETALVLVEAKRRAGGERALAPVDRVHLERAERLDASACELLRPAGDPRRSMAAPCSDGAVLASVQERLRACGIVLRRADLSRPDLGVPVVRAVAPALQPYPSTLETPRLRAARAAHGGGERFTGGVELLRTAGDEG